MLRRRGFRADAHRQRHANPGGGVVRPQWRSRMGPVAGEIAGADLEPFLPPLRAGRLRQQQDQRVPDRYPGVRRVGRDPPDHRAMTRIGKTALNTLVRSYRRHCPVTEGKQRLLGWTRDYIMPDEPAVVFRTKHGFSLQANLRNPEHQRMYFYGEHDERYEINNLVRILQAGDCCWDIGANIGFYTCLFPTLVGDRGRVIAFEPVSA